MINCFFRVILVSQLFIFTLGSQASLPTERHQVVEAMDACDRNSDQPHFLNDRPGPEGYSDKLKRFTVSGGVG